MVILINLNYYLFYMQRTVQGNNRYVREEENCFFPDIIVKGLKEHFGKYDFLLYLDQVF
jgi:hypothetical protein